MHMNGFGRQRLTAFRADHYGIEHLLAALVFVQQRPSARVDHVDVAPVHDRHDDRIEVEALLRQDILVALGCFLIGILRSTPKRTSFFSRSASRCRVIPSDD